MEYPGENRRPWADPEVIRDNNFWKVALILAVLSFGAVIVLCIPCFLCINKKTRFYIMTRLSCLRHVRRWYYTRKPYHVFILHEQDESHLAEPIKKELYDHYKICTPDKIQEGTDPLQAFKELIEECYSLVVIYPQYHITELFDHQITHAKKTLVSCFISALVPKELQEVCDKDKRFKTLNLKTFTFDRSTSVLGKLHRRLPKLRKDYRAESLNLI